MQEKIRKENIRAGVLLSALLLAVIAMVWNREAPRAQSETERCATIDNKIKLGTGLEYQDHEYREQHCIQYER